jgi:hypothetical protein
MCKFIGEGLKIDQMNNFAKLSKFSTSSCQAMETQIQFFFLFFDSETSGK